MAFLSSCGGSLPSSAAVVGPLGQPSHHGESVVVTNLSACRGWSQRRGFFLRVTKMEANYAASLHLIRCSQTLDSSLVQRPNCLLTVGPLGSRWSRASLSRRCRRAAHRPASIQEINQTSILSSSKGMWASSCQRRVSGPGRDFGVLCGSRESYLPLPSPHPAS